MSNKGKTYEEIYGPEKAAKLKELRRQNAIDRKMGTNLKGLTYEEIHGEEKAKWMREIRSGENHWMWNPDKEYFRGEDWPIARKAALVRDNYTCQDCGIKRYQRMDVHHLVAWHETHDNSLENLITLCRSCHIKREKPYLYTGPLTEETRQKYRDRSNRYWANPTNREAASKRMIGNTRSPKGLPRDQAGRFTIDVA